MSNQLALTTDRAEVRELAERIKLLPWAESTPPATRLALAQLSLVHGLSPYTGEAWAIPTKQGWRLMIGIGGLRKFAHRSGEYIGRVFRKCDEEERDALGARPGDTAVRCIVMRRKTGQPVGEFDGYGLARTDDKSTMNRFQLARLRAERDALKAAFPLDIMPGLDVGVSIVGAGESMTSDDAVDGGAPAMAPGTDGPAEVIDAGAVVDLTEDGATAGDGGEEQQDDGHASDSSGQADYVEAALERPYAPGVLRRGLQAAARRLEGRTPTAGQRGLVAACLQQIFAGENADNDRHTLTTWAYGAGSLNDLAGGQLLALYEWLRPAKDDGGHWSASDIAAREAQTALRQATIANGKQELLD